MPHAFSFSITRGRAAAFGLIAAATMVACSEPLVRELGDALVDAGHSLRDATSVADAQVDPSGYDIIDVTCDQFASTVTQFSTQFQTTTVQYAYVAVAEPQNVLVERCGYTNPPVCGNGATCTGDLPVPSCRLDTPTYEGNRVYVECVRRFVVSSGINNDILNDRTVSSTQNRILVRR